MKKLNLKNFKQQGEDSKSNFQNQIGNILQDLFPNDIILEEVRIPEENFVLDFFIPSMKLVIECQGVQHDKHIKFFHRTVVDFNKQKTRDQRKRDWCSLNDLKLIEIRNERSPESILDRIQTN